MLKDKQNSLIEYFIGIRIKANLERYSVLYTRFNISQNYCYFKILESYEVILEVINSEYPKNHIFTREEFIFDETLFALAYCRFICIDYLHNNYIIDDFVNKKLKSTYDGKFDFKTFNENLSEFMIFFYLFTSIYFRSDLYDEIKYIKYEPEGANNKRFEYAFGLSNVKINIEVKALDCDPLRKDNLYNSRLGDGDLFAKSYFPNVGLDSFIEKETLQNVKEISSNYRQLKKNIKRIKEKCINKAGDEINLGFIIINYGTSIEEFFSYLFNEEKGILNLIDIDGINNLSLFSMCTCTTLFFDEVYENNHILSIVKNDNEYNYDIFRKLRLDKYIFCNGKLSENIKEVVKEKYQMYKYICRNNLITIQRADLDEKIINIETQKAKEKLSLSKKIVDGIKNFN